MRKFWKLIAVLTALAIIVVVGLNFAIKSYLTDKRIKNLVIPRAEKTLGRKVTIGDIKVSLFRGITIDNFAIKEQDGTTDFLHSRSFKISYDLLPLLHKKLVVSEILFDSPTVRIMRDKAGNFNFNSLAPLSKPVATSVKPAKAAPESSAAAALPFALSVNQIKVAKAKVSVRDAKQEIPATDVTADLMLRVRLGRDFDLSKLEYNGHLDMLIDALYGKAKPQAKVTADFDNKRITYTINALIDKQKAQLKGWADNYLKQPEILLDITSKSLDLDYLAALGAALPQGASSGNKAPKSQVGGKAQTAIADSLPPHLYAHGKIKIDKTVYKKLIINDFVLPYELKNGVLIVHNLEAKTAGGQIMSNLRLDLTKPEPSYQGDLNAQAVKIDELGHGLEQSFADMINGRLQAALTFAGAGFEPDIIKKHLSGTASYALSDGRIEKTALTEAISEIIGLPELKTFTFKDLSGKAKLVEGGNLKLSTALHNKDLAVSTTDGNVNLDGKLNLPVAIKISPAMSKRIARGDLAKLLADEQGNSTLLLKVAGSYDHPKVELDPKFLQQQAKKSAAKEITKQLEKALNKGGNKKQQPSPPVMNLLKGILGQ